MTSSEVSFSRKITEDLSNVEFDTSEDVEVIPTFDSMGLKDELLRGIYTYGNHYLFRLNKLKVKSRSILLRLSHFRI